MSPVGPVLLLCVPGFFHPTHTRSCGRSVCLSIHPCHEERRNDKCRCCLHLDSCQHSASAHKPLRHSSHWVNKHSTQPSCEQWPKSHTSKSCCSRSPAPFPR